jgi:hypothetical protein
MTVAHYKPMWLMGVGLIILGISASCASPADNPPVAVALALPSPTPFQPQPGIVDAPYLSPLAVQPEPTYTPYPTPYLPAVTLATPFENVPAPSASTDELAAVNNPLTGLPAADPSLLNRRPMAVKIANAPDYIRPQSGLSLADVVFEYYIEWGETRFIAVFYSNDTGMAGPVRSGRFFDEDVARMYHGYLVFKYADPRVFDHLKQSDLKDFLVVPGIGSCPPFVIGKSTRDTYNNLFFNTLKFAACLEKEGLDNSRQPLRSGFFSDEPVTGALTVNRIYSIFSPESYNYWEYDQVTHKYFRYQESQNVSPGKQEAYAPLTDAVTGLPVTAENVVVIFAPYIFANSFDLEDEVYHIEIIDSGDAFVFRDGTAIPARWYRTDSDQPILLTALDGSPIFLRPGRTFYEMLGESSTYEQSGTDWRFTFSTP